MKMCVRGWVGTPGGGSAGKSRILPGQRHAVGCGAVFLLAEQHCPGMRRVLCFCGASSRDDAPPPVPAPHFPWKSRAVRGCVASSASMRHRLLPGGLFSFCGASSRDHAVPLATASHFSWRSGAAGSGAAFFLAERRRPRMCRVLCFCGASSASGRHCLGTMPRRWLCNRGVRRVFWSSGRAVSPVQGDHSPARCGR